VPLAGIVFNGSGQILVVKRRDSGRWEPPGGVLELDETLEDAAKREILEETGVRVSVGHLTGVYKNMALGVVALVFKCRAVSGHPIPTAESEETQWMSPNAAMKLMTPAFSIRIEDALGNTGPAQIRAHDGQNLV
jgi:8-oxo-dGTP diphosphatase